jgi:membrane fusion protein, multidrug efflux system
MKLETTLLLPGETMSAIQGGHRTVLAAGLVAVLAGCAGGEAKEADPAAGEATTSRVMSVEVQVVERVPFTASVSLVGTVGANQDVTISVEEPGTIRELLVAKGTFVRAGQPIARVDDRVLRAQAEQAMASARLASETWDRQRRLWEEDRIGTEMAYLQAKYNAETAEAGARVMQERLAKTVVRAPISGILDNRFVEVGSMVSPGTPVARLIDVGSVKVGGGVPERFAGQVRRGGTVEVTVAALGGQVFNGVIDWVGASVDEASRTIPVEVRIPNTNGVLKPGMVANVRLARGGTRESIVVPQEAVLRSEVGQVVFVAIERDGRTVAEERSVSIGAMQANQVVVETGLEPGERLIVVGQNQVAAGDLLQVVAGKEADR